MTRHLSPHNQITVPVLDCNYRPLAPTRPSRARRWLEFGRAVKVWRNQNFAIRLLDTAVEDCTTPDMAVNIDPGYRSTGIAIVIVKPGNSVQVVGGCELRHRGKHIVARMLARRSYRRNRRSRLRRRPARFNNRRRAKNWLPPSLESTLTNILTTVRHLMAVYPITAVNIESCKFDPRLLQDPGVHGKGYQKSERGQLQIREYVLQRDRRTCQYCGKRKRRLEVDHVVPKSCGGPYRISNLITACRDCNRRKDSRNVSEFLTAEPQKLRKVLRQLKEQLASATHMNRLMPLLLARLRSDGRSVIEHDAVTTAHTRRRLGIQKTHVNDAACLGVPSSVSSIPSVVHIIEAVGHGRRQMLSASSKYGTPRYTPGAQGKNSAYRVYCRLSRDRQGYTITPGHRLLQRRANGVTSGDLVRYDHPHHGTVRGYAVVANRNTRVGTKGYRSVILKRATVLARNNGYRHHFAGNQPDAPGIQDRSCR